MKTSVQFETYPFDVPPRISVKNPSGVGQDLELPLCAFDANTLWRLCDDFRNEVFSKAGVQQPPQDGSAMRVVR
jgi:hypothetical protein